MGEALYAKMRANERFTVALNATYSIKGKNMQHQACLIANLSSSGAKALFPRTESLQSGDVIVMDIAIPNTIMRIAAEAEIMWTRQRFNELITGIRFKEILSDSMIRQLVKKAP